MRELNEKEIVRLSPEEKYKLLDRIAQSEAISVHDFQFLHILSYDNLAVVRARIAEILFVFYNMDAEKILIRMLQDENELVRAKACDSLKNSSSLDILPLLLERAKHEKTNLVRGNASSSIAYVVLNTNQSKNKYIDFLYNLVEIENIKWVKLHLYQALYQLGETVFLYKLLDELNNRKIMEREEVVNLLGEIATDENRDIIKTALLQALKEERTIVVKSVIEKVINNL